MTPSLQNPGPRTKHASKLTPRYASFLNQYFYFSMSLLIAAVVVYGFSHTIDQNLIHPVPIRPWILYLHATVFSSWVIFFILQSALVRTHKVRVHRTLGWFGLALGVAILILGLSTAITMAHFNINRFHSTEPVAFLIIQFMDMASFAVPFALAILWRKKPEFHRRLILIASCALTNAAFGRFPLYFGIIVLYYGGVDALIFLGVLRDLIVNRKIHIVYRYALPLPIIIQVFVMYTYNHRSPWWTHIATAILR